MLDFIIQLTIVGSLALMIVILARALPRIAEDDGRVKSNGAILDRVMQRIPTATIDVAISGFLEKVLRKIRVVNLKLENLINSGIHRLRGESENGKEKERPADDLFEKK